MEKRARNRWSRGSRVWLYRSLSHAQARITEIDPTLAVLMALHNQATTLPESLSSVLVQSGFSGRLMVLVVNDQSSDAWQPVLCGLRSEVPIVGITLFCGGAAHARNQGLILLRRSAPRLQYIVRLDADDILYAPGTLQRIEHSFHRSVFSFRCGLSRPGMILIGSNFQRQNGILLPRPNLADGSLLERRQLPERLERMAAGDPSAELPSCNVLLHPAIPVLYPLMDSAEDHGLTLLLLTHWRSQIRVDDELMHSIYSLSGSLTATNRKLNLYRASRQALFHWALAQQ